MQKESRTIDAKLASEAADVLDAYFDKSKGVVVNPRLDEETAIDRLEELLVATKSLEKKVDASNAALRDISKRVATVESARLLKAAPEDLTGWKHFWQTALIMGLGPTVGLMPGQGLEPGHEPTTEQKNKLSGHITTLLVDMRLHPRSKKMTEAEKAYSLKHHTRLRQAKHDEAQSDGVIKQYRREDPMIRESSIPMFWDAAVLHPNIGKRFGMEPRPVASAPATPAGLTNVIPIARPRSTGNDDSKK